MNFEEWYNKEQESGDLLEKWGTGQKGAANAAWVSCKQEVLKLLDQYHHTSAFPYIKENIEKEI